MSTPGQPDPVEPAFNEGGFEDESNAIPDNAPKNRRDKNAERRANFMAVFGHGIGKVALIATGLIVVVFAAFAVRGFNNKPVTDREAAKVDVPNAPPNKVTVDPINEREAERRADRATLEAEAAAKKGATYQPDFTPVVVPNQAPSSQAGSGQPFIAEPAGERANAPKPLPIVIPAGQSSMNGGAGNSQVTEAQRRQSVEDEKERAANDKYIEQLRGGVREQAEELLGGKGGAGGIRGSGAYTTAVYAPRVQAGPTGAGPSPLGGAPVDPAAPTASKKPVIFKAGKAIFATLDAEVNTDDGGEVFATVHGGPYDGSKLIGKIEQAPRNIRLRFSVLAPQDNRPTLSISAIAIREEDAKQGVAETIDHHTLSRYTALFAGSVLSGIGKAAMQPQSNSVILPNGQVIVSQPEVDNKRIAMYALGEIGTNAGSEVRKAFGQPPTYITPANKGIGVIFLSDVNDK